MNRSKIKFQMYSMISMGIAGIGLLGTMIGNFVLLNARVGFFIGSIFYLVAMICECAFFITILSAIDLEEIDRTELDEARNNIIKWFTNTGIMIICAFVFCLPLLILVADGYWGLTAGAWFQEGGLDAAILFVLCMIISRIIFFASKKINLFQWWEEKSQKYQLQLIYVRKVGIAVLFTFILQGVFNYIADPPMFVSGTVFENYEDFQAYMEKGILEEEALTEYLYDDNGNIALEYKWQNMNVSSMKFGNEDGVLPITLWTNEDYEKGCQILNIINVVWVAAYVVEIALGAVFYWKKKRIHE